MYYIFQSPNTVKELSEICDTPKKLLTWMRLHIHHSLENDTIQLPETTLLERTGSYLDFMWLFAAVMEELDINCFIITVRGERENSACLFYDANGSLKCIVNRKTLLRRAYSIEEYVDKIDKHWHRWIEWAQMSGRLLPVKPHYRGEYGEKDTRNYLLRTGVPRV